MAGGSHDDGSRGLSEMIGSKRSPTDVGTNKLSFGKFAMPFTCDTDDPIATLHVKHLYFRAHHFLIDTSQLADLLDVIVVFIIRYSPWELPLILLDNFHHSRM